MKVIVTGGAGFIGSNLVDRLVKDGHDVIVIDNESSTAHDKFHYNMEAEYWEYDICDYQKIEPLFAGVDCVFHLAAESSIQPAIENPIKAVNTNVLGTCCVLQAARTHNVRRVVYSSTSSAYGLSNPIPNVETMPKDCLNPYSVSKTSGEDLCQMYSSLFGLETVIFRYFNVYGERQPTRGQYAPVIGLFWEQYLQGKPMTVVGDGLQRRDYIHVSDVVHANILAGFYAGDDSIGEIFNLGSGTNHNIHDLVKLISGKEEPEEGKDFQFIPERHGEARESLSDCTKAHNILKWQPKVALEEWIKSLAIL